MHKATDYNPDPRVLEIDNRYINPFGLLIRLNPIFIVPSKEKDDHLNLRWLQILTNTSKK